MQWFIARVVALAAVLALPILGTSYALVSSVSADIRMASTEDAELTAYARIIDLVPRIEAVHRDLEDGNAASERRDALAVDAALRSAERTYSQTTTAMVSPTQGVLRQWRADWMRARQHPSIKSIDRSLDRLRTVGDELDNDTPLENDPNFAVQNLVATVFRQIPRSLGGVRNTADTIATASSPSLDARSIELIATRRAFGREPLGQVVSFVGDALTIAPDLHARIVPALNATERQTSAFGQRIDAILGSLHREPRDTADVQQLARRAIDAHIALWRMNRAVADELIIRRYDDQVRRRRVIVVISLLAVVLGTVAITLVSRDMARRDRIELRSAKLESDKLRAELQALSTERALRLQEAQFRSVFENADLGIVIFEPDGTIAQHNAAAATMLGNRMQHVLAERLDDIAPFGSDREPFTLEQLHARDDGSSQWLAFTFSGVYEDGKCQMIVLLLRDMTEEKLLQQGLMYAASHDGLTQIANRSAFELELRMLFENVDEPFALMYIDLDKFKPINDRYGHAAGDHVLVTTAERLRSALASRDLCARLGGDEFAALIRGRNDAATLSTIAARIGASLAEPIAFAGSSLNVSASIGVAIRTVEHATGEDVKIQADRALYAVKLRGGNAYCTHASAPSVLAAPV